MLMHKTYGIFHFLTFKALKSAWVIATLMTVCLFKIQKFQIFALPWTHQLLLSL